MKSLLKRLNSPAVMLFFLSPALAELLSGSAPPNEFFNPAGFLIMVLLYGGGALLVRELVRKWQKGWESIMLLGLAYAIVEEAILTMGFFNPNFPDLGNIAGYGRFLGINFPFMLILLVYHTLFSISVPIILVEMLFPAKREELWLSRRGYRLIWLGFFLSIILGLVTIQSKLKYTPPPVQYMLAIIAVIGLFLKAKQISPRSVPAYLMQVKPRAPWAFFVFGFFAPFLIPSFEIFKGLNFPFPIALVLFLLIVWAGFQWLVQGTGYGKAWRDIHRFWLIAGCISLFAILAPIQELSNPTRPDDTSGMALVGLMALVFLLWAGRKILTSFRRQILAEITT